MTQLSKEQIDKLFDFVRSKYVPHIDVQHELVDHLASDIESEMNEDNTLSFESALSKVYSKFPISGFSKYVKQSESVMNTMWYKMILSEFTKYGGIPFLIALVTIVYTIFLLLTYFTTIAFYTLVIAVVIFGFISTWKLRYIVKGESHNEDDKYLVVSIFKGWAMTFTALPVLVSQYFSNFEWVHNFSDSDKLQIVIFSFLLSINIIWNVMAFYRFPALISNVLNEKYNHLNLEIKLNSD